MGVQDRTVVRGRSLPIFDFRHWHEVSASVCGPSKRVFQKKISPPNHTASWVLDAKALAHHGIIGRSPTNTKQITSKQNTPQCPPTQSLPNPVATVTIHLPPCPSNGPASNAAPTRPPVDDDDAKNNKHAILRVNLPPQLLQHHSTHTKATSFFVGTMRIPRGCKAIFGHLAPANHGACWPRKTNWTTVWSAPTAAIEGSV